jgi:flagellar protein FliS
MPAMANPYLEAQVATASPERLHLMVIDGAIRFARQAQEALQAGQFEKAFLAFNRSRECVNDILAGIDSDPNPGLADQLRALFAYVLQNLASGELLRDPQHVQNAIQILESHRQTWAQLIEIVVKARPETFERVDPDFDNAPGTRSWTT